MRNMELIDAASAEFERVVGQLRVDSWARPTPSEVTVRELVEHVVVGNRVTALLLAGVGRDEARAMLAGDQLGPDPVAAVAESATRQAEAFAATPPNQSVTHPNGDIPPAAHCLLRRRPRQGCSTRLGDGPELDQGWPSTMTPDAPARKKEPSAAARRGPVRAPPARDRCAGPFDG